MELNNETIEEIVSDISGRLLAIRNERAAAKAEETSVFEPASLDDVVDDVIFVVNEFIEAVSK